MQNVKAAEKCMVGVGCEGLRIFSRDMPKYAHVHATLYDWASLLHIEFQGKNFIFTQVSDIAGRPNPVMKYSCASRYHAKTLWKCAIRHHVFFRVQKVERKTRTSMFSTLLQSDKCSVERSGFFGNTTEHHIKRDLAKV